MKALRAFAAWIGVALCAAPPAAAQGWDGLVIGQSGPQAPRAFADAFHVAESLKSGGLSRLRLLRDMQLDQVRDALDALAGAERAVIYLTGPLTDGGDGLALPGGTLRFDEVTARARAAGVRELALLIETCPGAEQAFAPPPPPEGVAFLRAGSVPPGGVCTEDAPRLSDLLTKPLSDPTTLSARLAPVWLSSDLATPVALAPTAPAEEPVVSIVDTDVVTLSPVSPATESAAKVTLAALEQPTARSGGGEVVIFSPTPQSQLAARPTAAGLPEPSIIVGLIQPQDDAAFEQVDPPGEVSQTEISYENLEARRALRAQDPEQFAALVAAGAFDPPEQLLATALQTELARMGCYTAGIDGIWGGGSRRSVERYFDQIDGATAVSLEPDTDLFRQVITQDDVTCPVVAAAPSTRSTTRSSGSRATRSTSRARSGGSATTRNSNPSASQPSRTISNSSALGVYR